MRAQEKRNFAKRSLEKDKSTNDKSMNEDQSTRKNKSTEKGVDEKLIKIGGAFASSLTISLIVDWILEYGCF